MLVHVQDSLKQDVQILVIKPGLFREVGADEATNLVQAERDDLLAAHRVELVLRLLLLPCRVVLYCSTILYFVGNRHTGDGNVQRKDSIQTFSIGDLHRAAHLPRVGACGHDCAEGADIVEQLTCLLSACVNGFLRLCAFFDTGRPLGFRDMAVDVGCLLDDDIHAGFAPVGQLHIISDTALGRAVGDKALHGLRIDPGHIAHVGIAVWVCIRACDIVHEFVSVLNCHKIPLLLLFCRTGPFSGSGNIPVSLLIKPCSHLIVAQRKVGLLLQIQGSGNGRSQRDRNFLQLLAVLIGKPSVFDLFQMVIRTAAELADDQSRHLDSRSIVALHNTGIDTRHGRSLDRRINGHQPTAVIGGIAKVQIVFLQDLSLLMIDSIFPKQPDLQPLAGQTVWQGTLCAAVVV